MTDDWRNPSLAQGWSCDPHRHNPLRAEQVDVLLTLIEAVFQPGKTLLDLGSGSGLIEAELFERVPHAQVVGIDRSEPMMALAAERLKPWPFSFIQIRCDLSDPACLVGVNSPLPRQFYQVAFSVQALHHLSREGHLAVYLALAEILEPGGWFFTVDRMAVDASLFEAYQTLWARLGRTHGFAVHEGADMHEHAAMMAKQGDTPLPVRDHLALLAEAGFTASVVQAYGNRALIAARKP
ncbi:MAG TPA: class I SAM-dependent methyltransferase [Candidatus Limnocylindrales bacterium]|nr:class I SAM-dependent methyltransferase [Candidatus Limnocylindrales bacterium]